MKLIGFDIQNYKSVSDLGICEVNEKVTVLAGKNESGKTNILEALFKLNTGEKFEEKEKTLGSEETPFKIKGMFKLDADDVKKIVSIITKNYSISFSEDQLNGFERLNTMTITKNEEDYTVEGQLYSGVLKIISKDARELCELIVQTNDVFKDYTGRNILIELNLELSENSSAKKLKSLSERFLQSLTQAFSQNMGIFQTLIQSTAQSNDNLSDVKNKMVKIESLSNKILKMPSEDDIKKIFVSNLPNIILFKSFDEEKVKDIMNLEEAKNSQFVKDLTKISKNKLDILEIIKKQTDDFWIQNFQEKFSATISKDFMDYWDHDKRDEINEVEIKIRIANSKISFFVSNPKTRRQLFPSQRSKGFQWFLSFYSRILSNTNDGEDNIILIDEPGLFLHAKAQKSVLKVLNNLSKKDQIIYATHSPYLIEEDKLERIRLVEKDAKEYTHIVNKFYDTKDQDTLTPILTAIGHDIFAGISFEEKKNSVIVEGISDYIILKSLFEHIGLDKNNKLYIIPMKGANSIAKYVPFFIGWDLNFLVVVDNDDKGKEVEANLIKNWLVKKEQIIHISTQDNASIEDLFTHEEYFKLLLGKDAYDATNLISKQINDGQKVLAANMLKRSLTEGKLKLSQATKDNFISIHKKISEYYSSKE